MRRVAHGEAAPRAVAQHDVEVLAGVKVQFLSGRNLQFENDDVGRHALQALHARRQLARLDVAAQAHFARRDHQVRERLGLAEQRVTLGLLGFFQRLGGVLSIVDLSGDHLALA